MESTIDTRNLVISCLAETIGTSEDKIDITSDLSDLGIDSLSFLRLKAMLENKFSTTLPDDFEHSVTTGEEILAQLERQPEPERS